MVLVVHHFEFSRCGLPVKLSESLRLKLSDLCEDLTLTRVLIGVHAEFAERKTQSPGVEPPDNSN